MLAATSSRMRWGSSSRPGPCLPWVRRSTVSGSASTAAAIASAFWVRVLRDRTQTEPHSPRACTRIVGVPGSGST